MSYMAVRFYEQGQPYRANLHLKEKNIQSLVSNLVGCDIFSGVCNPAWLRPNDLQKNQEENNMNIF